MLFARPESWPSRSWSSHCCRGAAQSSSVAARTVSASSTSTSIRSSARSAGVGRGSTRIVAMCIGCPREPEANRVRAARGARPGARRAVRRRSGTDRRLRALLLVHRGDRHVPRRRGDLPGRGAGGPRGASGRAPARDRLPRRPAGRGHRRAAQSAPVRGAGLRHLRAPLLKARLFTDGGARGNPGPAAFVYVLEAEDGTVLAAHGEAIGVATNNVAEYRALVAGLERAAELQVGEVEVVSDSELLVKQMTGEYRVKNEALRRLSLEAARLARQVGKVRYTAVRREQNELADRLVNEALDAADLGYNAPPTRM